MQTKTNALLSNEVLEEYSHNERGELLINGYPAGNSLPLRDKNISQNHQYMTKRKYVLAAISHTDTNLGEYPQYFKNLQVRDGEEKVFNFSDDAGELIQLIYIKELKETLHTEVQSKIQNFRNIIHTILPLKNKKGK